MAYVAHTFTRLELPFDMWWDGHDWGCRLEIDSNFQHESERRAFGAVFFGASKQHAEVAIYKEMLGEDWIGGPVRLTYYLHIYSYLYYDYVYIYIYIFYLTIYIYRHPKWLEHMYIYNTYIYICMYIYIYISWWYVGQIDGARERERENGSSGRSPHSPSMWLNLLRFAKTVSYSSMNFEERWKCSQKWHAFIANTRKHHEKNLGCFNSNALGVHWGDNLVVLRKVGPNTAEDSTSWWSEFEAKCAEALFWAFWKVIY